MDYRQANPVDTAEYWKLVDFGLPTTVLLFVRVEAERCGRKFSTKNIFLLGLWVGWL